MAAKRKLRKGLATNIMCVLHHEGAARPNFFARRFDYAEGTIQRTFDSLERRGLVQWSMMHNAYALTSKGRSATYRSRMCGHLPKRFAVTRAHSDRLYVPIRGARRR